MAASILSLDTVSLTQQGQTILDAVSLDVAKGEHWALLGPNGCGKTTILKLLTGYLWPSSGTVRVLGDTYGSVDLREKRRTIGLVSSALFERIPPRESFREVVLSGRFASLGLYEHPTRDDYARADDITRRLGRDAVTDRPYQVLSFGERQSALIGRALMADPALLILDEPCEGLDIAARERILRTIDTLIADPDGPTILLVTHRVEEIAAGITHIALMRDGRITSHGPRDTTLTASALGETLGVTVDLVLRNGRTYAIVQN